LCYTPCWLSVDHVHCYVSFLQTMGLAP
jgi:hypothetical protein